MSEVVEYRGDIDGFELVLKYPRFVEIENNVPQLVDYVTRRLEDYKPDKYGGDTAAVIKDKKELSKGIRQVSEVRRAVERLNPYKPYIDELKKAEKIMRDGLDPLREIYHTSIEQYRSEKTVKLKEMWASRGVAGLVPYEKAERTRWLNKTVPMYEIEKEMDILAERYLKDMRVIELACMSNPEKTSLVKAVYLADLDVERALAYADTLIKNANAVASEDVIVRRKRKGRQLRKQAKEESKAKIDVNIAKDIDGIVSEALGEVGEWVEEEKSYTMTFRATESQYVMLRQWLTSEGIVYNECKEIEF